MEGTPFGVVFLLKLGDIFDRIGVEDTAKGLAVFQKVARKG